MGAAALGLGEDLADLHRRVEIHDRHIELSVGDQAGQFGKHLGTRTGRCPRRSSPVLRDGREIGDAVTVGDRDHATALQSLVVVLARKADDLGPGPVRELDGERADPTGGFRDDHGLTLLEWDPWRDRTW